MVLCYGGSDFDWNFCEKFMFGEWFDVPVLALRYVIPLSSKQPLKNLLCAGRDLGRSDWVSFFRAFICSYFAEESLDHGKKLWRSGILGGEFPWPDFGRVRVNFYSFIRWDPIPNMLWYSRYRLVEKTWLMAPGVDWCMGIPRPVTRAARPVASETVNSPLPWYTSAGFIFLWDRYLNALCERYWRCNRARF